MRRGAPSLTAQRVAGHRLRAERLSAPLGDPAADECLARDVAGSLELDSQGRMARYLRARTAFFDRVVVNALGRDVTQIACVGAGYDGRSLRYSKPGVRWFEVDHPATQTDKRARLERLGIDPAQIDFVALDLDDGGLETALLTAGWDPESSSLMMCEGLLVYLELRTVRTLLGELRALASPGTRLALSFSVSAADEGERRRFREAVAAAGEPIRNDLSGEDPEAMLAAARWKPVKLSERATRAGFVVAAPASGPATGGAPPTASRAGRVLD